MKISDIIRLAALNLYRRLARTMLTVIGVVIGTACIVIMIAIGLTNLKQFDDMLQNARLTQIEVMNNESGQRGMGGVRLDDAAVKAFGNIDNVKTVVPTKRLATHCNVDKYHADYLSIIAVPPEVIAKMAELDKGRYFNQGSAMPEIIMGVGAARRFIETEDDYRSRDYEGPGLDWMKVQLELYLGSAYELQNPDTPTSRMYRTNVVGIIKDENEKYHNDNIYISLDVAKRMLQENYKLASRMGEKLNEYSSVFVYADDMKNVTTILDKIRKYGFDAYSETQFIEEMQNQQKAQQGQLAAIGLISLLVSAIGIANTMMTGILERRGEIGVMKVVGVAISKIRKLFLIESAMIGFVGGIAGVILSHILAYLLSTGTNATMFLGMHFGSGMKFVMPIWLDIAAIAVAVVVGVIAGIFPARKATKMSPLEAIRTA